MSNTFSFVLFGPGANGDGTHGATQAMQFDRLHLGHRHKLPKVFPVVNSTNSLLYLCPVLCPLSPKLPHLPMPPRLLRRQVGRRRAQARMPQIILHNLHRRLRCQRMLETDVQKHPASAHAHLLLVLAPCMNRSIAA
jgi:hypothetical protein